MNVGVVGNPNYPDLGAILATLSQKASQYGLALYSEEPLLPLWPPADGQPAPQPLSQASGNLDCLITLGGDGTLMEVLSALAHQGPPVGVLAGGTANVVARTLRIPLNPARAIPLLLNGDEAILDLGRLGDGRRFAIGVGVGLDATMISEAPARLKKRFGFMAYVIGGYKAVIRNKKFSLRLSVDGTVYDRAASAVLIANFGAVLNDFVSFGDGILQDDGLLNACVFSPDNLRDSLRILWRMIRRDFGDDPCLFYKSGREFRVETLPQMPAQADGELLGGTPLTVRVDPLAGRFLIPRRN